MNPSDAGVRVPATAIAGLIADAMGTAGLPPSDAAKVAELMTEADLTGADAHGVFRLPQYIRLERSDLQSCRCQSHGLRLLPQ
jgi:L-2-hydroxycarboxylate dehydrogenase (NAD+)